jgi:hypothetical protein
MLSKKASSLMFVLYLSSGTFMHQKDGRCQQEGKEEGAHHTQNVFPDW